MALRTWPKDFEKKEHITRQEKALLRMALRNFADGCIAVNIDPLGFSNASTKMGFFISPNEGLITFSLFTDPINASSVEIYRAYVTMVEDRIYERLLDSKLLIAKAENRKVLCFPYKHIIMFPNDHTSGGELSLETITSLLPFATYEFFRPLNSNGKEKRLSEYGIFSNIRKPYANENCHISDQQCCGIFERLAPEYTVVMNETEPVVLPSIRTSLPENAYSITGREHEFKTFFLDEYQVGIVNEMRRGHRVVLANPGAGKSVLLLSRAFKYASMFKDSKVLLTCYNNNLADSYCFKRSCADFGDNQNLYIMTFHKLVKKIYEECLHTHLATNIASVDEIEQCIEAVKNGSITLRFKAIFVDEVQIFDPLYLELCYLLLSDDEDRVFLMSGDLNQAVRALSRKGDAPWKRMRDISLDFTGRVRYIEKNYRNSQRISVYISRMLKLMNDRFSMLDMINPLEYEYNAFKAGDKPTIALKVQTGLNRLTIKDEVVKSIQEIATTYRIKYSDIAILFPYKKHSIVRYFFLYWLEQGLNEAGIPYSLITSSSANPRERTSYSQTTGVVLSTIDSSLGLDFKAVIVAGLYPYNYVFNETTKQTISSWSSIKDMPEEFQSKVQSQMRAVYTACSRARDVLYVLSDLTVGSPMEEIIREE